MTYMIVKMYTVAFCCKVQYMVRTMLVFHSKHKITLERKNKGQRAGLRVRTNILVFLTGGPGRPSTPGNPDSPFLPWRNREDDVS